MKKNDDNTNCTSHIEYMMKNINHKCKFGIIATRLDTTNKKSYFVDVTDIKTSSYTRYPLKEDDFDRLYSLYIDVLDEHRKIKEKLKKDKEKKKQEYQIIIDKKKKDKIATMINDNLIEEDDID